MNAVHDTQFTEHGGLEGVRDQGLIEAALARPQNLVAYGDPDAAALAAAYAYAYGIAKNHRFADGNTRTGWILVRLFLADNGVRIAFDKAEAVRTMTGVAEDKVDEAAFADWLQLPDIAGLVAISGYSSGWDCSAKVYLTHPAG